MQITVALDYYPNTNHTGFYVAREKGWYQEDVVLRSPHKDNFRREPESLCTDGAAQFAVAPIGWVVTIHVSGADAEPPQSVAAILQRPQAAVVTLASSGIKRPADLAGKTYASYGPRYEAPTVQRLVEMDGGTDSINDVYPGVEAVYNDFVEGRADAAWFFWAWEGVDAQRKGLKLNAFRLAEYGLPDGHLPMLIANAAFLREHASAARSFLQATAKGFEWAASHPDEAAQLLVQAVAKDTKADPLPEPLDLDMVKESQRLLSKDYLASGKWGIQSSQQWEDFVNFMRDIKQLSTADGQQQPEVKASSMYTTDFL